MQSKHTSPESGMAMVVALTFIAVALLIIAALSTRLMQQRLVVDRYHDYRMSFEGVEAAVANSKVELEKGEDGIVGMDEWTPQYASNNEIEMPAINDGSVEPVTTEGLPGLRFMAYAVNWFGDGRDNNGDGQVDNEAERFMYSVHARSDYSGTNRVVEAVFTGLDVNVWRNAIFAGSGQAGGLINGNVSIHGSVHLLANNLIFGNAAIAAIDISGTSLIHNNYNGVPATLLTRIPPLREVDFGADKVSTLDANLRVKRGLVGMSGNSEIGEPNIPGNAVKETMDGTYVTDGWTGTAVIPDGDRGIPKSVSSDNGWSEEYDLGDKVALPLLGDDWRHPNTGAREARADTGAWYSHEAYFSEVLLAKNIDPNDGNYNGSITIDASGKSVYWNATTGEYKYNAAPAVLPAPGDDYIYFDAAKSLVTMNGQIRINGDLTFTGKGNARTINYSGRAAILVTGDTTINCDLLTCNNGNVADIASSYPVKNIIGIMSKKNMTIGATSQCQIMGAFYAQERISISKQTHVAGTIVSNYFDMGTNVPNIYQVPTLADNLPLGMIGNYPILTMKQLSWRELAG